MPAPPQIATWFILFAGLGQVDGAWYTEDKDELIIADDTCINITFLAKDISISCDKLCFVTEARETRLIRSIVSRKAAQDSHRRAGAGLGLAG
ncbi:uncharacterized protein FTJAE_5766 [Fusarium tjaetaba]|uniref:Uncharacterized protein n=1 Tax=Fusarium tjaetaba TaxID=1567544 RepID=A0A8H5VVN9_9HYPO|nr:uncharacterized protein FTJAE_5766 [Fusarium tjaetaba]KAF5637351.1 hypothetical protein FTJAE_5766 [Fusarium tjaetaba]